jgi:hypothetical protein
LENAPTAVGGYGLSSKKLSSKKLVSPPGPCVPAGAWQRFHVSSLLSGWHGILSMCIDSSAQARREWNLACHLEVNGEIA